MVTLDGIRTAGAVNPYGAGARRAAVASRDLIYGMSRMYQLSRPPSDDELEVFRELDPALAWLGLTGIELPEGLPEWASDD